MAFASSTAGRRVGGRLLDGSPDGRHLRVVQVVAGLVERLLHGIECRERLAEDGRLRGAGIDERHGDAPLAELQPQGVAERLHAELRRVVGTMDGQDQASADRPDIDDATVAAPDQRQERLDDGQLADEVHLQLLPEVGQRLELERPRLDDARVVDEAGQAALADGRRHRLDRARDRRRVGDVDEQRREITGRARCQGLAVGLPSNPGEDPQAHLREMPGRSGPDARGGAGDDDRVPVFESVPGHWSSLLTGRPVSPGSPQRAGRSPWRRRPERRRFGKLPRLGLETMLEVCRRQAQEPVEVGEAGHEAEPGRASTGPGCRRPRSASRRPISRRRLRRTA